MMHPSHSRMRMTLKIHFGDGLIIFSNILVERKTTDRHPHSQFTKNRWIPALIGTHFPRIPYILETNVQQRDKTCVAG